jgi:hypothetical protein
MAARRLLTTTYNLAIAAGACDKAIGPLQAHYGKTPEEFGHDTPVPLTTVLDVCGLVAALWALDCVLPGQEAERDRIARQFAADCAALVLSLYERQRPGDDRPRAAIETARRFAVGVASAEKLAAAGDAAWAAVWAPARDAWAVWAPTREAARAAAWAAARAAGAAAWDAARAAGDAAREAAREAARDEQTELFRAWLDGRAEPIPLPPFLSAEPELVMA